MRFVACDEPPFLWKAWPSASETACGLVREGTENAGRFRLHRRSVPDYRAARAQRRSMRVRRAPLVGRYEAFDFIDEFHYDATTMMRQAALLAP